MPPQNPVLTLSGIRKQYGACGVVNNLDLEVLDGETLTLLGPAGCGKTTALRIIAGLEEAFSGEVRMDGAVVTRLPPWKRQVGIVFQGFALFPHMDVWNNVAYGPKMLRLPAGDVRRRVADALDLLNLAGEEKSLPSALTPEQALRAAIARAAVLSPRLLLLDEPLLLLEPRRRRPVCEELRALRQKLGCAFVVSTRSPGEAMDLSDRIALLRGGRLVQLGAPRELYDRPKSVFSALFFGEVNLLPGNVVALSEGELLLDIGGITVPCESGEWVTLKERLCLCIRPEQLRYGRRPAGKACVLHGVLTEVRYVGGLRTAVVALPTGQTLLAGTAAEGGETARGGETVCVWWEKGAATVVRDDRAEPACPEETARKRK